MAMWQITKWYIYSIWQDSNDIPIGDNGLAYESMTVQDPYPPKKTDRLRVWKRRKSTVQTIRLPLFMHVSGVVYMMFRYV